MIDQRLSQHFYLREFLRSETATRLGRSIEPSPEIVENLRRLCELVLEPLRMDYGAPMTILSGYRPDWLNTAIHGSPTSEHVKGRAADFLVQGLLPRDATLRASKLIHDLPVSQLIEEFGQWTHIGICALNAPPKRELLTARKVGPLTRYEPLEIIKA